MPQYGNLINAHTNKRNLAAGYGLLCCMLYNYNIIKFESSGNDFWGILRGLAPLGEWGVVKTACGLNPGERLFPFMI